MDTMGPRQVLLRQPRVRRVLQEHFPNMGRAPACLVILANSVQSLLVCVHCVLQESLQADWEKLLVAIVQSEATVMRWVLLVHVPTVSQESMVPWQLLLTQAHVSAV
jgi:hypothetical protein